MTSLRTAKRFVFPLLGLWALLYASITLVQPPLLDGQDALSAEIAREMLTGGHWITPFANGIRYAQHPPLLYWTVAASFRVFGVSDWAARLPLAIAALFLFIAVFSLGRRLYHAPNAAFYSALALITSYGVFLFGHLLLRDVFLCLWTTLAINCFWRSLSQEKHRLGTALGFAACCALGVLTEGIAGVVFPLLIVLLYLIGVRRVNHLLRWHPIPAVLLFLAILLPEHIAATISTGHAPLASLMPAMTGGSVPLWIFWPLLLLWIVPWCAFSLRALRTCDSSSPQFRCPARMLCVIWILVVLVGFSFTARLEYNLITALPPMALLAGGWLADDEALTHHHGRIAAWILWVLGMAAAALVSYFLFTSPAPGSGVDIATLLRPGAAHHPVFFTYFLNLTHRAMGAFRVPLAITLAALLVGVTAGLDLSPARQRAHGQLLPRRHDRGHPDRRPPGPQHLLRRCSPRKSSPTPSSRRSSPPTSSWSTTPSKAPHPLSFIWSARCSSSASPARRLPRDRPARPSSAMPSLRISGTVRIACGSGPIPTTCPRCPRPSTSSAAAAAKKC